MANKKTQREFFNEIIAVLEEQGKTELVDFCKDRIEKLNAKSASRKPTKTQEENEELKDLIMTIVDEKGMTITEIQKKDNTLGKLSNQKVSALVRLLAEEGKVTKTKEGKTTLVKLA